MIEIYKNNDSVKYNNFINNIDDPNIFINPDLINVYVDNYDVWWIKKNNTDICVALILYKNNKIISKPISFLPYYGPKFSNTIEEYSNHKKLKIKLDATTALLETLQINYNKIHFVCDTWTEDVRPYQWINYNEENLEKFTIDINYTGIIDLKKYSGVEDYFKSIRYVRRQDLKKNKKLNCSISWSSNKDQILDLISLRNKTFKRQNQNVNSNENLLIENITKKITETKKGELLIIKDKDKSIGAAFIIFDKKRSYYLFAASDPEYRDTGVGTRIVYESIKRSFEKQIRFFDFVGVNSPFRGDFKLSFNPIIVPYYSVNWAK